MTNDVQKQGNNNWYKPIGRPYYFWLRKTDKLNLPTNLLEIRGLPPKGHRKAALLVFIAKIKLSSIYGRAYGTLAGKLSVFPKRETSLSEAL